MQAITDHELLQKCSAGDRDAFAVIVHRYQNLVCSVAYSVLGDFTRSEDVGQETLVAAWKQLPQLEDLAKFRPWISSIARHKALSHLRKERANAPLVDDVASTFEEPSDLIINQEEETLVWQALQGLPENYREPLVLFYRQDCSVTDVALSMDLTEDTVRQRLHRGRELLRTEVTSIVERTLRKTVPGAAFTMAVMGCVVGLGAGTASAAAVGTAGKMSAPIVMAAAKTGLTAGVIGSLAGAAGAFIGPWMAMKNARYEGERRIIRETTFKILCVVGLTCLPFVAMGFGWKPWQYGPEIYISGMLSLIVIQIVAVLFIAIQAQRRTKAAIADDILAGTPPLAENKMQQWLSQWEGRNFKSKTTLLGLPLVHINTRNFTNHWQLQGENESTNGTVAKGWIAIGETAYGVLLAMGGRAVGGIAFGGISAGVIAVGGVSVGLLTFAGVALGGLAIGGCALGVVSWGGLAFGWMSFGGGAFAWKCAFGGAAIASEMAVGGYASAIEANTEVAKQFVESNAFFRIAQQAAKFTSLGWVIQLMWIVPLLVMFAVSYRRRDSDAPAKTSDA